MITLKIKDRGLYIDIVGASPARSPAEIDITKCSLMAVDSCLRNMGVKEYEIISIDHKLKSKNKSVISKQSYNKKNTKNINQRFYKLEKKVEDLLKKNL